MGPTRFSSPPVQALIPTVLLGAMFALDSSLHHSVFQLWWLPLAVAYYVFLKMMLSQEYGHGFTVKGITTGTLVLAAICIFTFNDTVTTLLWGGWLLALAAIWAHLNQTESAETKTLRAIGLLVAASLLILPVSVNRVSIILPSLSGQTHFTIQSTPGSRTIPGAHHYQSLVNYEEQRIQLSAQNYFTLVDDKMFLQLENDQDGVRFVIQDIIFEHAMGLFKLSILKIRDLGLEKVTLHPDSDPVEMSRPPSGGIRLTDLAIGDKLWLELPAVNPELVTTSQYLGILGVRLVFWLVLWWGIMLFRPRQAMPTEAGK